MHNLTASKCENPLFVGVGSLLAFLAMSTQIPVPFLDKIALVSFTVLVVFLSKGLSGNFLITSFLVFCLFFVSSLTSLLLSYGAVTKDAFILLFYLTTTFIIISINDASFFLKCTHYALLGSVLSGLFFFAFSYLTHQDVYVTAMWAKGLPNVFAASGFATTPQVFATYCSLLLLTCSRQQPVTGCNSRSRITTSLAVMGVLSSMNRVWLIFLTFRFAKEHKYWFIACVTAIMTAALWLKAIDLTLFLVLQTLSSRLEMIISLIDFYLKQDLLVQVVGNIFFNESYFALYGRDISYLENGQLFLLNKLGVVGLLTYAAFVLYLLKKTLRQRKELFPFACYYLVLAQFMTHEFLSFSFWLFTMMLLLMLRAGSDSSLLGWQPVSITPASLKRNTQ